MGIFNKLAQKISTFSGKPASFCIAFLCVMVWAITGPAFHYSEKWQLVINTGTTIITFLMVFLIQNTQNRDMLTLQLKLDELIKASSDTDNTLLNAEELEDKLLLEMHNKYKELARNEIND